MLIAWPASTRRLRSRPAPTGRRRGWPAAIRRRRCARAAPAGRRAPPAARRGARRVAVVQQQDVARGQAIAEPRQHLRRLAPRRCRSRAGSSSPARGPSRSSTGASRGLRRPAGARKKRGATPTSRRAAPAPRRSRASKPRGPEQREGAPVAVAVVLHAVAAARDLAAERGMARGRRGDDEEGRAGAVRVEQVEHGRRDLRIRARRRSSSRLSRRAAAAAGRRHQLRPSQRERGQSPPPVSTRWLAATAPRAQGQCRAVRSDTAAPAATCTAALALTSAGSVMSGDFPMAPGGLGARPRKLAENSHGRGSAPRRDHRADRLQHRDLRLASRAKEITVVRLASSSEARVSSSTSGARRRWSKKSA